ncbi:hypothetical protein [Neobacillus kokaensis]|uniref:Tissue inhibitor of metalloproteinase n=1 Tax=Neobacillus kokaensis TaxID=2759023 RepID=A0ABQ3NA99_9BACI|nr:hypothetical protein [Neobacillus kokaensis]GHH98816.1 hypothetical protein AM1BK_23590 [Neobacillus kokaensis]
MVKKLSLVFTMFICLSTFALTVKPSVSYACKCVETKSVEKELELSDAVFNGKIIEMKQDKYSRKILFEVTSIWKGLSTSQIVLIDEPSSCSMDFNEGQEYLVYAKNNGNDVLTSNICDRTIELISADKDLLLLGEGRAPTEIVNLENELKQFNLIFWIPFLGIAVLIIVFIWKRKRMENIQ